MSFLTYARSLKSQAAAESDEGHEIMIHVPMEPDDANEYAGPMAIRWDLSHKELARWLRVPFAARDFFLDADPSPETVVCQLKAVEQAASEKGYAIAIGHPNESTLSKLEHWLPTLASRGFMLVPVSAMVGHRQKEG